MTSKIQEGHAQSFVALARAPTVTLPRLKALTSGTPPLFLDLILNLDEGNKQVSVSGGEAVQAVGVDSWVTALSNVVFYGDDTWLRLFPGHFIRSEGVHSFMVTDWQEVDRNVTRHLGDELSRSDWNGLILHYLGVDHIGHCGGIRHPAMPGKLQEMDQIWSQLYKNLRRRDAEDQRRTLLIMLGDHGMTDGGNHGGSSPPEQRTAMIFAPTTARSREAPSPRPGQKYDRSEDEVIEQVDLVPTLSVLLGLPIPRRSTGKLIASLIPEHRRDAAITLVCQQLRRLSANEAASADLPFPSAAWMKAASAGLMSAVGEYGQVRMALGILLALSGLLSLVSGWRWWGWVWVLSAMVDWWKSMADWLILLFGAILSLACIRPLLFGNPSLFGKLSQARRPSLLLCLSLVYAGLQQSSSFIEEEHVMWHGFTPLLLLLHAPWTVVLYRLLTPWNATGYQWAAEADVRGWLQQRPALNAALMGTVLLALFMAWCLQQPASGGRRRVWRWVSDAVCLLTVAAIWLQKTEGSWLPVRLVYGLLGSLALCHALLAEWRVETTLLLGSLAQVFWQRTHNALPVALIALITHGLLHNPSRPDPGEHGEHDEHGEHLGEPREPDHAEHRGEHADHSGHHANLQLQLVGWVAWMHSAFFLLGPSHLIASIDFTNAYAGLDSFHLVPIAILTWAIHWGGSLLVAVGLAGRLRPEPLESLLQWRFISLLAVLFCCWWQSGHLSIWTVYAPRLVFEAGWFLFYALLALLTMLIRRLR